MAGHISSGVEYALHSLLFLEREGEQRGEKGAGRPASVRELAGFQGVPADYLAKIVTKLVRAGLVESVEGVAGGLRLARAPEAISVLEVVRAVDGDKPLFDCREIRRDCIHNAGREIDWAVQPPCPIHAVMIAAQRQMEAALAGQTLAALTGRVARQAGPELAQAAREYISSHAASRGRKSRKEKDEAR